MLLHILRHAKTDQFSESGNDFDRKLLPKGISQATQMGLFLNQNQIDPNYVFCSSAKRTRQTLSVIEKNHSFSNGIIYLDDLYLCEKEQLLALLWNQEHQDDILIIGHNNGISDFVNYLTDVFVDMRTCELITIFFSESNWKEVSKGLGVLQ